MESGVRWAIALVLALALVALLLFARGGAERGNPDATPAGALVEQPA